MPHPIRSCRFLVLGLLIGCGGGRPSTSDPGPPPPHGGNLVVMPEEKGFVEVVHKPGTPAGTASPEVTFYFLRGNSRPYSPAPAAGTLAVGKSRKLTLTAQDGGLATPPGPRLFQEGEVDGILEVDLDGKPTKIPLGIR